MTLRVFLTAPNIEPDATGESFVAYQWAKALSEITDLTVFSLKRAHRPSLAEALPKARVLSAPMPTTFSRWPRFEAQAKPQYPVFMREVRKALKPIAHEFDITFQIMPQAARYPIPLRSFDVPYVVGPLGGALETPEAFKGEGKSAAWFTRARVLDHLRFRHDPWLRASYAEAALVLGVAPYMEDVLGAITLKRFAPVLELGIADLPELPERAPKTTGLNLLHVGRGVRTKGLRDVIRAMGHLKDSHPDLTLMSAGTGEEIDICRAEAQALGIADRVTFKGQIAREEVETLYREADMFVFPSFREPAGNVLYEAMRWGLPVIAAARGGPDWIVDDTTGIRIPVTTPEKYAREISTAIAALAGDPERRASMTAGARAKLEREGLWPAKAAALAQLFEEVVADTRRDARATG